MKTKKTAGTSIEIAFSSICGPDDIITPIRKEDEQFRKSAPQNYLIPFSKYKLRHFVMMLRKHRRIQYFNHISAYQIKNWIGKDMWNSYYKFCFERNPWDKVISHYYYRGGEKRYKSVTNYFEDGGLQKLSSFHQYTLDGYTIDVDRVFPYENLKDSLIEISQQIGKEVSLPPHHAKGNYRDRSIKYSDLLTAEERFKIEVAFAREIKLMGYEYGMPYTGDGYRSKDNLSKLPDISKSLQNHLY